MVMFKKVFLWALVTTVLWSGYELYRLSVNYDLAVHSRYGKNAAVLRDLEKGAFINTRMYQGLLPVKGAACGGHAATVEILLQNGANPNDALNRALYFEKPDVVLVALRYGANPWEKTTRYNTATANYDETTLFAAASPPMQKRIRTFYAGKKRDFIPSAGQVVSKPH